MLHSLLLACPGPTDSGDPIVDTADTADAGDGSGPPAPAPVVYGDSAYGSSGQFLDALAVAGVESKCKTQPPTAAGGMFTKDQFVVDV